MLAKIRSIIVKSIKDKRLNVFGLFFLLAFLILVLSKLSKSYTETLMLDINFKNLSKERVLTIEKSPQLEVVVNTHGFHLLRSYFYDKSIDIDLKKDAYINNNSYVWIANRALPDIERQLGNSFKIESVQPDTLSLPFGTLEKKKVPVKLDSNVSFASGFDTLEGLKLIPDSVDVIGPKSEIKAITFIKTQNLRLSNIKENINTTLGLEMQQDLKTTSLSQDQVTVTANVEKFTEGTLEIPVTISNLPSDLQINYFPKTIKVSYEVSLSDYKSIRPSSFKIECDYLDIKTSNQSFFIPKFKRIPQNVKRVKMKQNKIEYIITE